MPDDLNRASAAGVRQPTMRDVARRAGVSQATVSNVLNHPQRVAAHRITAVQKAIAELGFVRHEGARQLRSGQSRTLGLLLLDAWNPAFQDMARGVEEAADTAGWNVFIANSSRRLERETTYLRLFSEARLAGTIVIPHDELARQLHPVHAPGSNTVVVDRSGGWDDLPSVTVDDVAGGGLAMRHVMELGHRHIAFVGDTETATPVHQRFRGMSRIARTDPTIRLDNWSTPLTVEGGKAAAERFASTAPDSRPTALLTAVDTVAIGLIHTLQARGIAVPDNVSVVGYDDISATETLPVPLTTVHRPHVEMGRSATALIIAAATGVTAETQVVFQPELVIRSSTKALS